MNSTSPPPQTQTKKDIEIKKKKENKEEEIISQEMKNEYRRQMIKETYWTCGEGAIARDHP